MEKYRRYADAATGINPFVLLQTPTPLSVAVAVLLFPLRLTVALCLCLLLFLADVLVYFFFTIPGLSLVSLLICAPCQRLLLRSLLFALGNISVVREAPRGTAGGVSSSSSSLATAALANNSAALKAGDVVIANMQSVWDMCVLELSIQVPLSIVAFYIGNAADERGEDKKDGVKSVLKVMEPSPLQRWSVWWHIYNTGSLEFLHAAVGADSEGDNSTCMIDVYKLQQERCLRLGVPLVLFVEGSCTNGKGMLRTAPLRVLTASKASTGATTRASHGGRLLVSALDYNTTSLHTVLRPRHVLSCLFAMSASLHGSRDPAWHSPLFPTATVRVAALVDVSTRSPKEGGEKETVMTVDATRVCQALCAASRSRRVLTVGLWEKCGYVEAYMQQRKRGMYCIAVSMFQKHEGQLPWWKLIVLDEAYRERITRLTTERYHEEMYTLQYSPECLSPATWDDGTSILSASQYIAVEDDNIQWATKHPTGVINASAFHILRATAVSTAIVSARAEEEEAEQILHEVKRLYEDENPRNRLYGLSYIWNEQLPPQGFIRLWPNPARAMWPSLLDSKETLTSDAVYGEVAAATGGRGNVTLPSDMNPACLNDPLCVHVFQKSRSDGKKNGNYGNYLGTWRQSLFLIRYKVICWALHEEKRRRTCVVDGHPVLSRDRTEADSSFASSLSFFSDSSLSEGGNGFLKQVPQFPLPLLRLQSNNAITTFSRRTLRVQLDSVMPPVTWEGIAPSPSSQHADRSHQNWNTIRHNSTLTRQAVRDVFNLLPRNEDGLLEKITYVEFVLDLLNLFFPTRYAKTSIPIAEEEWVYRGSTDLVNFETFFERFFSFPFIFLRDLGTVTVLDYVEVWCLIRVCLLEDGDTIRSSAMCSTGEGASNVTSPLASSSLYKRPVSGASARYGSARPGRGAVNLDATLRYTEKLRDTLAQAPPPLICAIGGISHAEIIRLGMTNFHNTDKYLLYHAMRRVETESTEVLRFVSPSRLFPLIYTKGKQVITREMNRKVRGPRQESCGTIKGKSNQPQTEVKQQLSGMFDSLRAVATLAMAGSQTTGSEAMSVRQEALERVEEERRTRRLIENSMLYQGKRQQQQKEHARVLAEIARGNSSWGFYQREVYELPTETMDEEDDLIAFVQDVPDDFFDDRHSLRVRYRVHVARLRALAERSRRVRDQLPTRTDDITAGNVMNTACTDATIPLPFSIASVCATPDEDRVGPVAVSGVNVFSPHRRLLGRGHSSLSSSRFAQRRAPSLSGYKYPSRRSSVSVTVQTRPATSPLSFMKVSLPSLPPTRAPEMSPHPAFSTTKEGNSSLTEEVSKEKEGVNTRRALQLRLQAKERMDLRYRKMLRTMPHCFNPPIVRTGRRDKKGVPAANTPATAR